MSLKLDVVESDGTRIHDLAVTEISLPGADGQLGVLPMHIQMISVVGIGPMRLVLKDGTIMLYAMAGGFMEILEDHVRILTEACEERNEIDVERAQKAFDRATARLQTLSPAQEEEFKAVSASLKRASTRLAVATGKFH